MPPPPAIARDAVRPYVSLLRIYRPPALTGSSTLNLSGLALASSSVTVLTAPSLSTPRPAELAALLHLLSR